VGVLRWDRGEIDAALDERVPRSDAAGDGERMHQEHAQAAFAGRAVEICGRAQRRIASDKCQAVNAVVATVCFSLVPSEASNRRLDRQRRQKADSISVCITWRSRLAKWKKTWRYDGQIDVALVHPVGNVTISADRNLKAQRRLARGHHVAQYPVQPFMICPVLVKRDNADANERGVWVTIALVALPRMCHGGRQDRNENGCAGSFH
jgi:hypothetical protein